MTNDEELFSKIRRIASIESQLVTRRSFLNGPDRAGAESYRELQQLRDELDRDLGYDEHDDQGS